MLRIKGHLLEKPIIQGGMGIGVSLGGLAGAVAATGAMGVVSTANIGFLEPDFRQNPLAANLRALTREIKKAKELARGAGMVAVNAMVATRQYAEMIRGAVSAGVDAVISGAGLPTELPELVKGSATAIAPIVSSSRAARAICRMWDKRHGVAPDFIVVEGPEAGGHLGYSKEDLVSGRAEPLEKTIPELLAEIAPFAEKYGRKIPVFAAGGIFTGEDVARFCKLGAAGAQVATRFIATYECDASEGYKNAMLAAKKEDVQIVESPVGMPGRALLSPLVERLARGERLPFGRCTACLTPCKPAEAPYCITDALTEAVKGNWEDGLFFCGSNVWRLDRMYHVSELIDELTKEWKESL